MAFLTFRNLAIIGLTLFAGSLLFIWEESLSWAEGIPRFRGSMSAAAPPPPSSLPPPSPPPPPPPPAGLYTGSSYHNQVSQLRPSDNAPHSKTLGVAQRVYVISLPKRTDRRAVMQEIADAMDIELTFHDATDMRGPEVRDIMERLRWWRNEHRANDSVPKEGPSPFVFKWADDVDSEDPEIGLSGSDLWSSAYGPSPLPALPPPPNPDKRPPLLDAYGEKGDHFGKAPLRPAQISCWLSHYNVLRKIAEGPDEVAIVLEDDVDIEFDLEKRLRRMWPALPQDWDLVMLGHCHSKEWSNPPLVGAPTLHPSYSTLCTHAYAVSRRSARRLVRRLRSEAFSYSKPIDHAVYHLYVHKRIKSFSVYPPVVVQTYELDSDIVPGRPKSDRSQWLEDSTLERIKMWKEKMAAENPS